MLRKVMFCMIVLGLVSCGGQFPIEKSVQADQSAYNCAVALREAAFAWKKDNADSEFYPSAPDLLDEVNMTKYKITPCKDGALTITGSARQVFNYMVSNDFGKKVYTATPEGVTSDSM